MANLTISILGSLVCPSDVLAATNSNGFGKTNYLGNMGNTSKWGATTFGCGGVLGDRNNGILLFGNSDTDLWVVKMGGITDGTSNTIAIGEVTTSANWTTGNNNVPVWAGGNSRGGCNGTQGVAGVMRIVDAAYKPYSGLGTGVGATDNAFGSQHVGGTHVLLCDGSVRFVSQNIDGNTYSALGSRDGGEVVGDY